MTQQRFTAQVGSWQSIIRVTALQLLGPLPSLGRWQQPANEDSRIRLSERVTEDNKEVN